MSGRQRIARMKSGGLRAITPASEALPVLNFAVRKGQASEPFPSVSAVGLWSCTGTRDRVDDWFGSKFGSPGLIQGRDWIGVLSPGLESVFLHVSVACLVLANVHTEASLVAREFVASEVEALQAAAQLTSLEDSPAFLHTETPVAAHTLHAGQDRDSSDEPWAEAFDFGRLVPVSDREIGGLFQPTVSARDVHAFLDSGRRPTTWFQEQVRRCSLVECVDWQRFNPPKDGRVSARGPMPDGMALTLSAAKKVAMTASGPRGAAVREYFVECERRLLAGDGPIPGSVSPALPAPRQTSVVASAPSSRSLQPSMPDDQIALTLADFLSLVGFQPEHARALAGIESIRVVRRLCLNGNGSFVGRNPATGSAVFARPALDVWWAEVGVRIIEDNFGGE